MTIIYTVLSWVVGPFGRYVVMGVLSVGFMAWIRADARAPYRAEIVELKKAAAAREKLEADDRKVAESNAQRAGELQAELGKLIEISRAAPAACKFSDDELKRLRHLAGTN